MAVGYHSQPDLASYIQRLEARVATLERQSQQFAAPLALASGGGSLSDNTATELTLSSLDYGSDIVVSGARLTVPIAGVYIASGYVSYTPNATGERFVQLVVNGLTTGSQAIVPAAPVGFLTQVPVTGLCALAAGGQVWLSGIQTSGGTLAGSWSLGIAWVGVDNRP